MANTTKKSGLYLLKLGGKIFAISFVGLQILIFGLGYFGRNLGSGIFILLIPMMLFGLPLFCGLVTGFVMILIGLVRKAKENKS